MMKVEVRTSMCDGTQQSIADAYGRFIKDGFGVTFVTALPEHGRVTRVVIIGTKTTEVDAEEVGTNAKGQD